MSGMITIATAEESASEQEITLDNVKNLVESPIFLDGSPTFETPNLIYSHDTLNDDNQRPIAGQLVDFSRWKQRSLSLDMTFVRQQGSQPPVTQLATENNANPFESSPHTPIYEHLYIPRIDTSEFSLMDPQIPAKSKRPKIEKHQKKIDEKLENLLDKLSVSLNSLEESANANASASMRPRSNSKQSAAVFDEPNSSDSPRLVAIKNNANATSSTDSSSHNSPTMTATTVTVTKPNTKETQDKSPELKEFKDSKDRRSPRTTTPHTQRKKTSDAINLVQEVLKLYEQKFQLLVQDRKHWTGQLMTIRDSIYSTFDPTKKFGNLRLVTAGSPFELGLNYIDDPFTVQKSPEREILVYDMKAREDKNYPIDPKYFDGLPMASKFNCLIRTDNSDGYKMCALSKKPEKDCKSKVENAFTLKILKTKRSNIILGIIPASFDFSKNSETIKSIHPGHSNKLIHPSYGFSCCSERYSSKGTFNHFGEQFYSGDSLTFFFNSQKKQIELFKNEESLGVMFTDIDTSVDYMFAVCLKDENDAVILV